MPLSVDVALFFALLAGSPIVVSAQVGAAAALTEVPNLKTIVVASEARSDSVISVPPATSVRINLGAGKMDRVGNPIDLANWESREARQNGLQSADLLPWHIVVSYDQLDEDGDNVHSDVYEEFWAGPRKYKRIYKSDNFNQAEYVTELGLYRRGDQQSPNRTQLQIREEIINPFAYAATLQRVHARSLERVFSGYKLHCVMIETDVAISDPTQYCFESDTSVLRYTRGFGWLQTVYNRIFQFQGRNLATAVDVTDGGKAYLKLRVEKIELLSEPEKADFLPPKDATRLSTDRVSGVTPVIVNMSSPLKWPSSLRARHFVVTAEIVIGKNGHVVAAHAVSGPPEAFKACEDAVRKWIFKPYFVLDKPVEVDLKVECSNN